MSYPGNRNYMRLSISSIKSIICGHSLQSCQFLGEIIETRRLQGDIHFSCGVPASAETIQHNRFPTKEVDVRLPGKGNTNSHGARPVHLIITMKKWIQTNRLPIKNSLSLIVFRERKFYYTLALLLLLEAIKVRILNVRWLSVYLL